MAFDWDLAWEYLLRLGAATLGGGVLGFERELGGHWAGMRTHMVVALAAATFVLLGEAIADDDPNARARVLQGVAAGIGFLGAGAILKLDDRQRIKGLTTAASIWLAAAVGAVGGLARYELLVVSVVIGIVVLALLRPISNRIGDNDDPPAGSPPLDVK